MNRSLNVFLSLTFLNPWLDTINTVNRKRNIFWVGTSKASTVEVSKFVKVANLCL